MPFGLKNTGATYQCLMNTMFKDHVGKTMEVYIDYIFVKSQIGANHVHHLKEAFMILREYQMKLNLNKYIFGVTSNKFFWLLGL